MKIKDLNERERPRERLARCGVRSLSDGELLAVLLRTGTRHESVLELAQRLLSQSEVDDKHAQRLLNQPKDVTCQTCLCESKSDARDKGNLSTLAKASAVSLAAVPGIGPAKAATLAAAFELGRRLMEEKMPLRSLINSPEDIFKLMYPTLKALDHEECWILYLDHSNKLISKEMATIGGQDFTVLDCRMVLRRALELRAAGLVLIHNHPSGDPHPGRADIALTDKLRRACAQFDIALIDHVIVADGSFYSFDESQVRTVVG